MSQRPLPLTKEVKDLFEDLLGRAVTVGPGEPVRAQDLRQLLISIYVADNLKLSAVVAMDLPLAVYAGAAIGLIPPTGAQASIEDGQISPMIAENVTEVCNVLSSILNKEGLPRVRMHQTFLPGQMPPADAIGFLLALGRRLDLNVEVSGYGSGRFTAVLAAA